MVQGKFWGKQKDVVVGQKSPSFEHRFVGTMLYVFPDERFW